VDCGCFVNFRLIVSFAYINFFSQGRANFTGTAGERRQGTKSPETVRIGHGTKSPGGYIHTYIFYFQHSCNSPRYEQSKLRKIQVPMEGGKMMDGRGKKGAERVGQERGGTGERMGNSTLAVGG